MQELIIDIQPAKVIKERVLEEIEYLAKKDNPEGNSYEQVTALEEDMSLLTAYCRESLQAFAVLLGCSFHKVEEKTDEDGVLRAAMYLHFPNNWDASLGTSLANAVNGYVAAYIKSRWLRVVKKDDEQVYQKDCDRFITEARNICFARVRPVRGESYGCENNRVEP